MNFYTAPPDVKEKCSDRADFDHYPTPLPLCRTALGLVREMVTLPIGPSVPCILDPGAGSGPWGTAARELWPDSHITGVEIREDAPQPPCYNEWFSRSFVGIPVPAPLKPMGRFEEWSDYEKRKAKHDLLTWCRSRPIYRHQVTFDIVMGNPPYEYAEEFCRTAMKYLRHGGIMVYLLRLAFLEGQDRGELFWPHFPPRYVYVHPQRPSFFPAGHPKAGKTDATAYQTAIWRKGWTGDTVLRWFPQEITKQASLPLFGDAA